MAEIVLNRQNFTQEVLQSAQPFLVDFWATWCGPCRMLAPVIAELAEEYDGTIKVGKVNVDEEPELARQFGIVSIPTVIVFRGGEAAAQKVGFCQKQELEALLRL